MNITLFCKGFVGGEFYDKYHDIDTIHVPEKYSRRANENSTDILYTISTVDNYNVFDDPTLDVKTNLVVLTETLDSWKKNNPNATFNFISSWFVYGDGYYSDGYSRLAANEESLCNPKGFYSITKRCAEQLIISFAETHGLKYRILRLGNILGPRDKKVSAKKNALQYLINKIKNNEDIDVYEKGDFYRNYMHVEDCASAIHLVMKRGDLNTIYNIGGENCKFIWLLNYVTNVIDYTGKFNYIEQKEFHKKVQSVSFMMNTTKLEKLGFQPRYDMSSMVDTLL